MLFTRLIAEYRDLIADLPDVRAAPMLFSFLHVCMDHASLPATSYVLIHKSVVYDFSLRRRSRPESAVMSDFFDSALSFNNSCLYAALLCHNASYPKSFINLADVDYKHLDRIERVKRPQTLTDVHTPFLFSAVDLVRKELTRKGLEHLYEGERSEEFVNVITAFYSAFLTILDRTVR